VLIQVIVCDSSCLIDLRKVSLLGALISLPYEITIPDTLFYNELIELTESERTTLINSGLKILETPPTGISRIQGISRQFPALSIYDCFAFALAERLQNSILLTGDKTLRRIATNHRIEVHGILWAIDEMYKTATATVKELYDALILFEKDPTIRLPKKDLENYLERYKNIL
jgi:predicted nucleic acid-binding protein